jgi:hypothetical protein
MTFNFGLDAFTARIFVLWGATLAATIGAVLWTCNGAFFFTLDDPYIDLAVAHNLLAGVYGVNLAEVSSPSSSILWPWLLVVTEALGLGAIGPLLLNVAAATATVIVALRLLRRIGLVDPGRAPWSAVCLGVVAVLTTSAVALPLTGLEHSSHVLAVVLTIDGLLSACEGKAPGWPCLAALVLMPLIRFEGLAFCLASLVALAAMGWPRRAAIAGTAVFIALAAYGAFTTHLGLPLLPSSVLIKLPAARSFAADGPNFVLDFIAERIITSFSSDRAPLLAVALGILVYTCLRLRGTPRRLGLYAPMAAAIGAHLAFGDYGWFHRYEVYVMVIALFGVLAALADLMRAGLLPGTNGAGRPIFGAGVALGAMLVTAPYVTAVALTPAAAANIYEQQFQMRRFVQDFYRAPIAVNDIGLVSWDNPNYVLDLWGLGSEAVRKLRRHGALTPEDMAQLAQNHGVGLAMIYREWFNHGVPASWTELARLQTPQVTSGGPTVTFYLTPQGDRASVLDALTRFKDTLPPEDQLTLVDALDSPMPVGLR